MLFCIGLWPGSPLGSEFITAFMQNHKPEEVPQLELLVIGSSPSTSVSITINKSDFRKDLIVGKGEAIPVPITAPVEMHGTGMFSSSVIIKSQADITVVSRNYKYASADTALLYPVYQLGVEYYIITPPWKIESEYKQFSVITYKTPNTVDIFLKGSVNLNGVTHPAGSTLTLTLEPFQAVQIQSTDDLSGTKIIAKNPIAVLTGHTCSEKNGACDYVYEQLLPVTSWGTTFFVPSMSFQTKYDITFVVASQDTSLEYYSGKDKGNKDLKAGEVTQFEIRENSPLSVVASNRIQMLLYGTGGIYKDKTFDPFLTNIPDIDKFGNMFAIVGQDKFDTNLAILLAKTTDLSEITFDGKAPQNIQWKVFPGTDYSWGEYSYGGGFSSHIVENVKFPFGLLSIGFSERIGYGSVAPCISGMFLFEFLVLQQGYW
ncbi:IgGFc-binding protein-like [Bombina bombina]|uniref:IgGFc-binding protein-like n=1 Tax=Bombina bombina TaxID=8345 RepID=UPI00235AD1B0|nr:IgGFc-binding protein-like [Bombina bombina]